MNDSTFERFDNWLSFWLGEPLSPCAIFRISASFSDTAAARGLVVATAYYLVLLHKVLLWKGMGLPFIIGQGLLRHWILPKTEFWNNFNYFASRNTIFFQETHFIFSVLETNSHYLMLVLFKSDMVPTDR